jgi:isoleucyl-tRNA synthetase
VLYEALEALVRLLAPVLIHTCEEVWEHIPWRESLPSVHLSRFPEARPDPVDDELEARWGRLLAVRSDVARELEKLRADKKIGSGLDAAVTLFAEGDLLSFLRAHEAILPEAFIVSEVSIEAGASSEAVAGTDVPGLGVAAKVSDRAKCARCWRLLPSVGHDADHPQLCGRCAGVVRALPGGTPS